MPAYDVVVHGGTLIDGTGAPRRRADLGIHGGVVAEIGEVSPREGELAIDASARSSLPG